MRVANGSTTNYIYFVAVDSTDLKTRKTGLTGFTVRRSRNGAADTAFTTPTVVELSATNQPGVYALLLNQDTTIAGTQDTEEMVLHITVATMAPVTRVVELFRRDTTANRTLLVDANGRVDLASILGVAVSTATAQLGVNVVNAAGTAWNSGAITASSIAAGAITATTFAANALNAVWSATTRLLTAGTNIVLAKGVGITGLNDLDAPGVRGAVGMAAANLDTQLATLGTVANQTTINNNVLAVNTKLGAPVGASVSVDIATNLSAIQGVQTTATAIKAKTDNLPADPASLSAALLQMPDAIFDKANGVDTGYTLRQVNRIIAAALGGKASGLGTTIATFRDLNDTKNRIVANVDPYGNRTAVTLDPS